MRKSAPFRRRLLFGLSVEDAQGKFDTPESRAALQLAHERYNKGIYHELQTAQRLRQQLSPAQKLHITRHTKPSVRGFQAYGKINADDYVVQELCWTCLSEKEHQRQEQLRLALGEVHDAESEQGEGMSSSAAAYSASLSTPVLLPVTEIGDREIVDPNAMPPPPQQEAAAAVAEDLEMEEHLARQQMMLEDPTEASSADMDPSAPMAQQKHEEGDPTEADGANVSSEYTMAPSSSEGPIDQNALQTFSEGSFNRLASFRQEQELYHQHRAIIIASMEEALDSMTEAVSEELLKKRRRHSVEGAGALFSAFPPPSPASPPPAPSNSASSLLYTSDLVSSEIDADNTSSSADRDSAAAEEVFLRSTSYPRHPHQHHHPDHANLVDRLVEEMVAAQENGFKPLSHLSAWFDPIQLRVVLNEEEAEVAADGGEDDEDVENYVKENGEPLSEEEMEAVRAQREEERMERIENARRVEQAFHSPFIAIPVAVDNVSFSLYVAGGLIRSEVLMKEFPYHIARFFVSSHTSAAREEADSAGAGAKGKKKKRGKHSQPPPPPPPPPPAAEVEVYFSAELYRVAKLTGVEGIHALRHFIGRAMQAQHSPTSLSQSILLNPSSTTGDGEHKAASLLSVGGAMPAHPTAIRIPWKNTASFSTSPLQNHENAAGLTEEERDGGLSMDRKRDAVQAVWRAWGHLVKDLHVHGDLDYLYVRIHQQQDKKETAAYIRGVQEWATNGELRQFQDISGSSVVDGSSVEGEIDPLLGLHADGDEGNALDKRRLRRNKKQEDWMGRSSPQRRLQLPISADFTVVECILEKRGLPHHVVMEDLTDTLRRLQEESTTVMRLAVMDEWALQQQHPPSEAARGGESPPSSSSVAEDGSEEGEMNSAFREGPQLFPIVYSPKVSVSHAGVVERGSAHTFQRIRIRGSQLAHVQALAEALAEGTHFTAREHSGRGVDSEDLDEADLPPNLSFSPLRAAQANAQYRLRRRRRRNSDASPLGPRLPPTRKTWTNANVLQRSSGGLGGTAVSGGEDGEELYRDTTNQDDQENDPDEGNAVTSFAEENEGGRGPSFDPSPLDESPFTEDEREFWKTHYYRLSNIRLVFYDRVEAHDVLDAESPRRTACVSKLLENQRLAEESQEQEREAEESSRGKKMSRKKTKKRSRPQTFSTEQIFHQLCVDVEREAARFDLFAGDCPGYQYWMRLRKLRKEETPAVTKALQSVRDKGFINYFSPHRFSSCTAMDRHPGLALLKGKFQSAASMLVQQIYIDAALRAEQARMKLPFSPQLAMSTPGKKYNALQAADFPTLRGQESRQSVLARASPMIHVLHNALQAAQLITPPSTSSSSSSSRGMEAERVGSQMDEDPCAEAFLQVLGLHPCRVLIHEFLAFLWNDLANQRLQRYGTFALLPGDLVRVPARLQGWLPSSTLVDVEPGIVHEASQQYASGDPRNEKGNAIVDLSNTGSKTVSSPLVYASRKAIAQNLFHWSDVVLPVPGADMLLPQNHTTDLYVLTLKRFGIPFNPEKREWDLFSADGNALGLRVPAQYRSLLVSPGSEPYRFAASLQPGMVGDPYQRWGEAVRNVLDPPPLLSSSSSSSSLGAAITSGAATSSQTMHPFLWQDDASSTPDSGLLTGGSGSGTTSPGSSSSNKKTLVLPFFTNKDTFKPKTAADATRRRPRHRPLPLPAYPYWYPQHNDGALDISIRLPTGISPWMMIREMTKSDVSHSDVVQLQDEMREEDKRQAQSVTSHHTTPPTDPNTLTDAERAAKRWRREQQRRVFQARPVATSLALLHQHIFRSSGVRRSLLPTLRSYDSVSK